MSTPRWARNIEKRNAVNAADSVGQVADSMEVRAGLIAKLHSGEMTLDEIQAELKRIKRGAKKRGLVTRQQVWRQA